MDTFTNRFCRHFARTRLSQTELADQLQCDTASVRAAVNGRAVPARDLAKIYGWVAGQDLLYPHLLLDEP